MKVLHYAAWYAYCSASRFCILLLMFGPSPFTWHLKTIPGSGTPVLCPYESHLPRWVVQTCSYVFIIFWLKLMGLYCSIWKPSGSDLDPLTESPSQLELYQGRMKHQVLYLLTGPLSQVKSSRTAENGAVESSGRIFVRWLVTTHADMEIKWSSGHLLKLQLVINGIKDIP